MDNDMRVKRFANSLFTVVYRQYNATFDHPVKFPRFTSTASGDISSASREFLEDCGKAVLKMCLIFRSDLTSVFTKEFPVIKSSVNDFMTYLTSRCFKLCGDDLFLSFVIICAFIAELNLFCCVHGCYSFISTAPKCLVAIFNRRMHKEFINGGGWGNLKLFCENFLHKDFPHFDSETVQSVLELLEENSSSDDDSSDSDSDISSMSGDETLDTPVTVTPALPHPLEIQPIVRQPCRVVATDSSESSVEENLSSHTEKSSSSDSTDSMEGGSDDESESGEDSDLSCAAESDDSDSDSQGNIPNVQVNGVSHASDENVPDVS